MLTREQREMMNQASTHVRQQVPQVLSLMSDVELRNCTIDDEKVTEKIKEFYRKLFAIEAVLCSVCLERLKGYIIIKCRMHKKCCFPIQQLAKPYLHTNYMYSGSPHDALSICLVMHVMSY